MTFVPSGIQYDISHAGQHATIVEVGAGVRQYRAGDRDVLEPYALDTMCDGAHGAPLIPWPNRLGDGRYRFDGNDYRVALTEPEKSNAIHGFLRWRPWQMVAQTSDAVTMAARLLPLQGYPFALEVRIEYRLDDDGLTVTTTATNVGDRPAPYGLGQHPYLSPGTGPIDRCTLQLSAATRILTDPERQLPIGTEAVASTPYDFTAGARLGALHVDDAFTDLDRDGEGRAWVSLTGTDQRTVRLWADATYSHLEIFTGDTLAPDRRRQGLGVEPMTCPPNAFQTGDGVVHLEPGATAVSRWGVSLTD